MNFVSDQLQEGHRLSALKIADVFTRKNLEIHVGRNLGDQEVINVLQRIPAKRSAPKRIYCDNCPAFAGRSVDLWAYAN